MILKSQNLSKQKFKQKSDFFLKMSESTTILFKSIKKKRPIRKVSSDSEEDENDFNQEALEETMELQKLRKRSHGVNAATLASGKKVTKVDEMVNNDPDPFKLKTGGLLTLDKAKMAAKEQDKDEEEEIIGTHFSKETRVRDEDEEMRKFIETEMEKRRGKNTDEEDDSSKYMSPEEQALMSLPEHLRKSNSKKNEEMLSSQMLSGIPEVDLGIDEKIRNIEATESAKKKLSEARNKKNPNPSEFVPTNLAVNFKQPNRFKTDIAAPEEDKKKSEKTVITQNTVVVGDIPVERVIEEGGKDNDPSKATDDLHLTKFKKQFQRK